MDTKERWVTVAEAVSILGVSDRTIRRRVDKGELAADDSGDVLLVEIAKHAPSAPVATPSDADEVPSVPSGADTLLGEIEDLRAELGTCQAELAKCQADLAKSEAERGRLFDLLANEQAAVDKAQDNARAIVDALSSGQLLLTERAGERPRRFRWPWQRREG